MQPKPPTPERSFLNVASVSNVCCHVIFVFCFFLNRGSNKDTCMSKPGFRVTVTLATLGVM